MSCFVICIAHKKGGVGKTSIAINLAVELSKKYNLNVIDLDTQLQVAKFNANRESQKLNIHSFDKAENLKNYIKTQSGVVIVDLGGYDSELSRYCLLLSDLIITPLSDSDSEVDGLIEFKKIILEIKSLRDDITTKVLLTRLHHSDNATHKRINEFLKKDDTFTLFETVIRARKEYKSLLSSGQNVCEQDCNGKACEEINKLIQEIEVHING